MPMEPIFQLVACIVFLTIGPAALFLAWCFIVNEAQQLIRIRERSPRPFPEPSGIDGSGEGRPRQEH